MSTHVYLNGSIIPAAEARLSAFDTGLTHGAGVFETFRAIGGKPFLIDRHFKRLADSAVRLGVPLPIDMKPWEQAIAELLQVCELSDARLRLTVTPGDLRRDLDSDGFGGTVLITAAPMAGYPQELYSRGMKLMVSSFRQSANDPVAGHKSVSYFPRLMGLREAQMHGCSDALWFTHQNLLAECSISNVFLVKDNALQTPPLDTPVLPGITRGLVLEMASENKIAAEEVPLTIDDVLAADEMFITNAIMGVMPVVALEKHTYGEGKPGAMTLKLMDMYHARML